ncbi:MAG: hypothetical protein Q9207_008554, partial [Kuettlingeria erythrocarpa]
VTAKDDNLGLGARSSGRGDDGPTTGLDGLQDLLGRLNGTEEKELEKQHRSRKDTRRTLYAERRWGSGCFVSGGFLVGDKIRDHDDGSLTSAGPMFNVRVSNQEAGFRSKVSKRKRNKHETAEDLSSPHETTDTAQCLGSDKKCPGKRAPWHDNEQDARQSDTAGNSALPAQRPLEKTERKAIRRARKVRKLAARTLEHEVHIPPINEIGKQAHPAGIRQSEGEKVHGRHAVRQRDRMFKKMSILDPRALNE